LRQEKLNSAKKSLKQEFRSGGVKRGECVTFLAGLKNWGLKDPEG